MSQILPKIFLIRHGETKWAVSGRHTGRADIGLTEQGKLESSRLGTYFKKFVFDHVLVSPLQRAIQTYQASGLETKAVTEQDLIEWDNGNYEEKTHNEIEKIRPGWSVFRDGCPGGEAPQQISDRADRLIEKLKTLHGNIAFFSHGHFGRVFGARWVGMTVAHANCFLLDTASFSTLGYQHQNVQQPLISLWNFKAGGLDEGGS